MRTTNAIIAAVTFITASVLSQSPLDAGVTSPEKGSGQMKYYDDNKDYQRPELENGVIKQAPNTWVKRSPIRGGPPSPQLGYEDSMDYDIAGKVLIRHGGHNQGGGGEQGFETWEYDLTKGTWELMYPNTSPPGSCCSRTNAIDQAEGKFIRFPGFSGNHGWQWTRRIHNLSSSVWAYDIKKNAWVNMAPIPEISVGPARAAAYDPDDGIILVFNVNEASRTAAYDLYANTWTLLYPENEPPPKMFYTPGFNMVYDRSQKLFVLFGAGDGTDPRTFTYDLKTNRWKDMRPPTQPPYDESDPVMAYDSRNGVTICVVLNKEENRLETWAYDAGLNRWRKMDPPEEPDMSGSRARLLAYSPDQNLIILENRTSHGSWRLNQQQIWTYRYDDAPAKDFPPSAAKPRSRPRIITDIIVTPVSRDRVEIAWKPESADAAGYNIYRTEAPIANHILRMDPNVSFKRVNKELVKGAKFIDDIPLDKVYAYRVHAVNGTGEEGGPSPFVLTIPSPPQYVFSKEDGDDCLLKWQANPEKSVIGYNIYRTRRSKNDDRLDLVTKEPVKGTTFTDVNVRKDMPAEPANTGRRYYITAVDFLGQESFPSSPVWFYREWRKFYTTKEWHQ